MIENITINEALERSEYFSDFFKQKSWNKWKQLLEKFMKNETDEILILAGRRSGKTYIASMLCVYQALFQEYDLSKGEIGHIFLFGTDKLQAQIAFNYIKSFFEKSAFKKFIKSQKRDSIELKNNITISVNTTDFRSVRGYSIVFAVFDEACFYFDKKTNANPISEIYRSVKPGTASIENSKLLLISSPYAASGFVYNLWKRFRDKRKKKIFVRKFSTRELNPNIKKEFIEEEIKRDPEAAKSEWLGQWRAGITQFLNYQLVENSIENVTVRPPKRNIKYTAFCDAASGQGNDSMSLSIAHREQNSIIQDVILEEQPPFSPKQVVKKFAAILKDYRIKIVYGDKYSLGWVEEKFRDNEIRYKYS